MKIINYLKREDIQSNSKKALSLSIAGIFNTLLNMVLMMLAARDFSKAELAVYSQSQFVCNTAVAILQVGIPSGIYYYFVRNKSRTRAVFLEGLLIVTLFGGLFSILVLLGGNKLLANIFSNPDIEITMLISIPYIMVTLLETVTVTLLIFKNRIKYNSLYSIIKSFILVSSLIICIMFCNKGAVLFSTRVLISCTISILCFALIYIYVIPIDGSSIHISSIKELLKISAPLGVASMAGTLSSNLDNWIISSLLDPETFAVFHMGSYEIPFISIITGSIMTVVIVEMNEAVKDGEYHKAITIFSGVAKKSSIFLMPIMVYFYFAADNFICFLYTDTYIGAVLIFKVYLLYIPIRLVTYGPLMIALGKAKALLKRELITLLLNALMSVFMVKLMGAVGACLSTIIVAYLYAIPANLRIISTDCNAKWYRILPFRHIGKCIALSIPGGVVSWLVDVFLCKNCSYFIRLIIMFLLFSAITIILYDIAFKWSVTKTIGKIIKKTDNTIKK